LEIHAGRFHRILKYADFFRNTRQRTLARVMHYKMVMVSFSKYQTDLPLRIDVAGVFGVRFRPIGKMKTIRGAI